MIIIKSLSIFLLTGLCEIGGGYLVWLWLREGKPFWYGLLGGFILVFYGVVATLQTSDFARVNATYGGVFIVMSLLWASKFDNYSPGKYNIRSNNCIVRRLHYLFMLNVDRHMQAVTVRLS